MCKQPIGSLEFIQNFALMLKNKMAPAAEPLKIIKMP